MINPMEGGGSGCEDVKTVAGMCRGVMSPDYSEAVSALVEIRKRLAAENPPIAEVLASPGCVLRIVQFLSASDNTKLQYEALWVITNLCSGTDARQTQKVVDFGALPQLIALLSSPDSLVCEQAAWALGNIEGTGPEMRNAILELGFIPAVVKAMHTFQDKPSLLRNAIWAFSNGCRGKPPPPDKYFIPSATLNIFPTLAALLQCSDMDIVVDTAWSLSYLTDMNEFIKHITASGICSTLSRVLDCNQVNAQTPVLRALGNISTGSDADTQAVIDAGVLPKLLPLLNSPKKTVRKETCWLLSNIAAGTSEQIRCMFVERGLFEKVIELINGSNMDIKREAAWIACNAASCGSTDVTKALFTQGGLDAMIDLIDCLSLKDDKDTSLLMHTLDAIDRATKIDGMTGAKKFTRLLLKRDVVDKLIWIRKRTENKPLVAHIDQLISFLEDAYGNGTDDGDDKKQEPNDSTQQRDSMDTE